MLFVSSILHWLTSESFFLSLVTVYDVNESIDPTLSWSVVGFSPFPLFFCFILGSIAVLAYLISGFRRYDGGIPLVGNSSAAISAACHRPATDLMAFTKSIMWGVTEKTAEAEIRTGVGHCCLTSFEVTKPVEGNLYAGLNED